MDLAFQKEVAESYGYTLEEWLKLTEDEILEIVNKDIHADRRERELEMKELGITDERKYFRQMGYDKPPCEKDKGVGPTR
ncbi:MAG: hypothetical protein M0Z27_12440 [Thermaerobacter sp.]|jgi:hypothetical protein|nr:hypothetical protein [Thermaerobacter sp.]MDA8146851.1 hypothetical protein [Thermaerobacter sp.]